MSNRDELDNLLAFPAAVWFVLSGVFWLAVACAADRQSGVPHPDVPRDPTHA